MHSPKPIKLPFEEVREEIVSLDVLKLTALSLNQTT